MLSLTVRRALVLAFLLNPASLNLSVLAQASAPAAVIPNTVTLSREPAPVPGVQAVLRELPAGVRAAVLVRDVTTGQVLESLNADQPFIPASALKTVTGAAVLVGLGGESGWWSTELTVPAAQSGQAQVKALTLRGTADPTLSVSEGQNSLRALAQQAARHGLKRVGQVRLDETRLNGDTFRKTVYEAAMPAVRVQEWEQRPPQTAQEARTRLGAALIYELRRAGIRVDSDTVTPAPAQKTYTPPQRTDKEGKPLPPDPVIPLAARPEQAVASVRSGSAVPFVYSTLRPSDNGRAETLLATLGVRPDGSGTLAGAIAHEKAILKRLGINTEGIQIEDGSGLGRGSRLSARVLTDLLKVMYDLPYPVGQPKLPAQQYATHSNAFVESLPLAGTGENLPFHGGRGGTMALRLVGSGLDVRAKTGTLPGVSNLTGYVRAASGRLLAFAILMNGPETAPLLTLRSLQDRMVREMAAAH